MALPSPPVDERTWDDLLGEVEAVVHRLAPAWTDHNASDPGRTLLELLAWITEADLFRAARLDEASVRAFLRWIGVYPRPAGVAETWVHVIARPATTPFELPAGTEISDGGARGFRTVEAAPVGPARLVRVQVSAGAQIVDRSDDNAHARSFAQLGEHPAAGDALRLDFDAPLADSVSLYVHTGAQLADRETRAQLDAEPRDEREPHACDAAETVWELLSASGEWRPVPSVHDGTRALSLSGPVRLHLVAPGAVAEPTRSLRCRLARGRFDCPPRIVHVGANAVRVHHGRLVRDEDLGRSTGRAQQLFTSSRQPIAFHSARVDVGASERWRVEPAWDRVGAHARACVLDEATGRLRFGDGRHGAVPAAGERIRITYCVGGGPDGNVAAGTLDRAPSLASVERVLQPVAAVGGAPAETLDEARARARGVLREVRRAVTLADFEALALRTPGVRVARARALAEHHPDLPGQPALGCVSVVVIPDCYEHNGGVASCAMRDAVACYLDRRRTLTSELHVVGARFVEVVVQATLSVEEGTDHGALVALARARLEALFHPLSGGPDGGGWPIGRGVYRSEIFALLLALPHVLDVDGLALLGPHDGPQQCGNVPLCGDALVRSGNHVLTLVERRSRR